MAYVNNTDLDIPAGPTSADIQAVIDGPAANGQRIALLKYDVGLTAPLSSGAKPLHYQGAGPVATRLLVGSAMSAIEHGFGPGQPLYAKPLQISNVGIFSSQAGTTQPAMRVRLNKNGGGFTLENVTFGTFNSAYGFSKYIELTGGTRTTLRTVRFEGNVFDPDPAHRAAGPQIGMDIISNNNDDKSYEYVFDDVLMEAEVTGFRFRCLGVPGNSGSLEGISFKDVRGRTNMGPWIDFQVTNGGWKPPLFVMGQGCNYQGTGAIAHFDGVEHLIMRDNWHACDRALTGSPTLNQVQVVHGRKITIENNTFRIFAGSRIGWVMSILSGCDDVVIRNNTFIYEGPATMNGGIFVDAATTNLTFENNVFIGWPVGLPKAIYSNGNQIPLAPPVEIRGTLAGNTDASGRQTITFPSKPNGSPYFNANPIPFVTNGDTNSGGGDTVEPFSWSATQCVVQWRNPSGLPIGGGQARRVNWSMWGN